MSDDQKHAIDTLSGKSLLFAVPGSGKTTVIVARTGYLLHGNHGKNIEASSLMTLTFTKAAAIEMKERYQKKFFDDENDEIPDFRTIHSFCLRNIIKPLRRKHEYLPEHLIGDEIEVPVDKGKKEKNKLSLKKVLQEAMWDYNEQLHLNATEEHNDGDNKNKKEEKKVYLSDEDCEKLAVGITYIKNRMLENQCEGKYIHLSHQTNIKADVYFRCYENILHHKYNAYDFDDMLIYSLQGINKHPSLLQHIRQKYHYWSIDEAQDNSPLQNELLKILVGKENTLFMVGDDDQSIYGFRGAEPSALLEYGLGDDVRILVMDKNYRSDQLIVKTAKNFIQTNKIRADKNIIADSQNDGAIDFYSLLANARKQYKYVTEVAHKFYLQSLSQKDKIKEEKTIAILYRLNHSAIPVAFWLKRERIPFSLSKNFTELMQGRIFREAIQWLKFLVKSNSFKCFKAISSNFKLYHWHFDKEKQMKRLMLLAKEYPQEDILNLIAQMPCGKEEEKEKAAEECKRAIELVDRLKHSKTTYEIIRVLILENHLHVDIGQQSDRLRCYSLLSAVAIFNEPKDFLQALVEIQKESAKDKNADNYEPAIEEKLKNDLPQEADVLPVVFLSSMHSAKGREFDQVLIIDSLEPPEQSGKADYPPLIQEDPEEARRLFYVAMTRAKHQLDILTVQEYHGNTENPSSFIFETANAYEDVTQKVVAQKPVDAVFPLPIDQEICLLVPQKFYAVKKGKNSGIYLSWAECSMQVTGYPGAEYKSFTSQKEAEAYLGEICRKHLRCEFLQHYILPSPANTFNVPCDSSPDLNEVICHYFHVNSLLNLSKEKVRSLKQHRINFHKYEKVNYHDNETVKNYLLTYLPVNYYKSWLPLSMCLRKQKILQKTKVMEIGPGPGTMTMSLFQFYQCLAKENPKEEFVIDYHAIEAESEFICVFLQLVEEFVKRLHKETPNLYIHVNISQENIFQVISSPQFGQYDLLIESNAFNSNENNDIQNYQNFTSQLPNILNDHALAILIEFDNLKAFIWQYMESAKGMRVLKGPESAKVDISKMSLYRDSLQLGIRTGTLMFHRFAYGIYEKI